MWLDGVGYRMSALGTSAPRAHAATACEVALVGDDSDCDAIVEVLIHEGFQLERFPSVQAIVEADRSSDDRSPIVLWLEDPISSVPHAVEPLSTGFQHRPVVVVCPSIERWELRAALAVGAVGVVTSDEMQSRLGPCLRAVRVGQVCVPREHWRQVEPAALSAREKQVLNLVVMGFMNSEIAERLFLAESTVKSHLSSAFGKLGVRSRNEAADLITRQKRGLGLGILARDRQAADSEHDREPANSEQVPIT
jgi:DNA-binding NarL/FixJ family response regulator